MKDCDHPHENIGRVLLYDLRACMYLLELVYSGIEMAGARRCDTVSLSLGLGVVSDL